MALKSKDAEDAEDAEDAGDARDARDAGGRVRPFLERKGRASKNFQKGVLACTQLGII